MNWQDYGTGRCCTGGCRHRAPEELSADVSRFSSNDFENAAKLMRDGADVRTAVATVNRLINQRTRQKEWWEE